MVVLFGSIIRIRRSVIRNRCRIISSRSRGSASSRSRSGSGCSRRLAFAYNIVVYPCIYVTLSVTS